MDHVHEAALFFGGFEQIGPRQCLCAQRCKKFRIVARAGDEPRQGRIIAEFDAVIPFIIQPAAGPLAPESTLLIEFQDTALGVIPDVRVIPQAHKILHVP